MEVLSDLIYIFLHLDRVLENVIAQYGTLTYAILFIIIFCETGLVITPFLPGDSLLFAAGALAAMDVLNIGLLAPLLMTAAVTGDTVNYWIGHWIGPRAFSGSIRFLKKKHLERTARFYEKHGGKTIILARFVPIIRTFAPFVAGIGAMNYPRFIIYNIVGGAAWVTLFTIGGYYFGHLPFVKQHFEMIIIAIILISITPIAYEVVRNYLAPEH